jgi:hypothetical protein
MKKQTYDLEERMLEYSVRIIKNDILEETEELIKIFVTSINTAEKKQKESFKVSRFDIGFIKTNEIKLRSGATSSFDVRRWTFNVGCSVCSTFIFQNNPVRNKCNLERLQYRLALMRGQAWYA